MLKVGNLSAKRDLSDVRDVVRAYLALMARGQAGDVYNISSQKAYKIRNVLRTLLSLSKEKITVKVDQAKNRPAEIPILMGNNSKIRKAAGWGPKIPIEKTLKDTLDFWRKRYRRS